MNVKNLYAVCLSAAVFLSQACGAAAVSAPAEATPTPAPVQSSQQPAPTQADAPADDLQQIVRLVIELPRLQKYYHVGEAPDRKPLLILKNESVGGELRLSKFGEPVKLVTCDELKASGKPYLELAALKIEGETASAVFRYRVEGVEGRLTLAKRSGVWSVEKGELVEAKFTDKGCTRGA